MRARMLAVLTALALPALASAQYDPNYPPPPPPPRNPPPQYRQPQQPRETGLTLAARVGYGKPYGDISNEGDPRLDDLIDSKIPIWLEIGYRFDPALWGGLYLELAPLGVNDTFCLPGRSCDGLGVRFGVDLQFHLAPRQQLDPWVGIGIGAEFISVKAFDPSINDLSTFDFNGFEFPLLEGGLDFALSRSFTLGPYVSWSLGEYTGFSVDSPGFATLSGSIHDRTFHSWFQIGLKGTFKL